ncbi:MAG: IS1 family transposase [Methanosarcinaceae archaeon]|nr:IS1 family transposase [Methanosarcinaceae archaeon]
MTDVSCKFCGSKNVVKYGLAFGKVEEGIVQRYRCKDCFRTFKIGNEDETQTDDIIPDRSEPAE